MVAVIGVADVRMTLAAVVVGVPRLKVGLPPPPSFWKVTLCRKLEGPVV